MRPEAKRERLLVEELAGEAVVYDLDSDTVHRLDQRAYQVWRSCDGSHTAEMIASAMHDEQPGEHSAADCLAVVEAAIYQLLEAGLLLAGEQERASAKRGPTRRDLLAKAGAAGGLILVYSIAAPTPAMAASPDCGAKPEADSPCFWTCTDGGWTCEGGGKCHTNSNNVCTTRD